MNNILKEELLKEGHKTVAGCLMLDLTYRIKNWKDVLKIIDSDDVYQDKSGEFGLEKEPHITVLFGFDNTVHGSTVEALFEDFTQNIKLQLTGISVFEGGEGKPYDVIKFDVISEDLGKLNEMCKKLPHKSSFPDYHPHMTVAYVKKGRGKRYIKKLDEPLFMEANAFKFSSGNKDAIYWKIKKKYRYNIELDGNEEK